MERPEGPAILPPISARALLLPVPANTEPTPEVPDAEGENEPLVPEPDTDEAELDACAEPLPCPVNWLGLFRDAPFEPDAAPAMD